MLKDLVKNLKPSSTLAINETSRKLEEQGKKIFKFGFGQSPFKVPVDVVEELKTNAHQNQYLPMQGLSKLRDAVAKYNSSKKNLNYKSENVIIGPGSKELMFLLHIIFDGEIILKDKNKNYLLFLNSPNNPSGQVCENLEEISQMAKKYNLIILSDEILNS